MPLPIAHFSIDKSHIIVAMLSSNSALKRAASGPTWGTRLHSIEETSVIDPDELPAFPPFEVDDFLTVDRMVVRSLTLLFPSANHRRKNFSALVTMVVGGTAGRAQSFGNKNGRIGQDGRDLLGLSTTDLTDNACGEEEELTG